MKLVLFDFDGTLTKKDTMWSFLRFHAGTFRFILNLILLSPLLVLHVTGFVSATKAKQVVLRRFLTGLSKEELQAIGKKFCSEKMDALMNNELLQKLKMYQQDGFEICIVTASCGEWVNPFSSALNAELIATKLQYGASGKFEGELGSPNCKGAEKVKRIEEKYRLGNYTEIIAYGNAPDDLPMMKLAHKSFVI